MAYSICTNLISLGQCPNWNNCEYYHPFCHKSFWGDCNIQNCWFHHGVEYRWKMRYSAADENAVDSFRDAKFYFTNQNSIILENLLTLLIRDDVPQLTNLAGLISDYCRIKVPRLKPELYLPDRGFFFQGVWSRTFYCKCCKDLGLKTSADIPFFRREVNFHDTVCYTCKGKANICLLYVREVSPGKVPFCQNCLEDHGFSAHDSRECHNPFEMHSIISSASNDGLPFMTGIDASQLDWSNGLPRPQSACQLCFNNILKDLVPLTKNPAIKIFAINEKLQELLVCNMTPPKSILRYDPPIEENGAIFRPKYREFVLAHYPLRDPKNCFKCSGWHPICDACNEDDDDNNYRHRDDKLTLCCDSMNPLQISKCAKKFGYLKVVPVDLSKKENRIGMCLENC
ncbi:MAG: hypothetical protein Hyperionvirus1_95 [Hyperionvirus sp.]|uniref:C3H1-type domain-containing protein n=1 Tax=Hyperionvirus sp. TaxID=2487770 RepID=A0A3G5A5J7_9VIRU|nr:MAG: hypothetical protein Hyperionvirus1_95 [Hyperionvirus sp.]